MSYDINRIFADMEQEIMKSFNKAVSQGRTGEWQAQKHTDIYNYQKENRKIIDKYTRLARDKATKEIVDNYGKGMERADGMIKKTGQRMDYDSFHTMNRRKMDALLNSVNNDFNKIGTATLRKAEDEYRQTMYKSQVFHSAGAVTTEQAVDMASKEFLQKGINAIQYSNGNMVNIASYAEMVIRTSSKKAYLSGEGSKMAEWGEHLVQVTSYGACSDTCLPWQGEVYFDDVFSGGTPGDDNTYPLLSMAMDEGLYHPNCRHTHNPWFEGISEKPILEKSEEDIKETYRAEQEQRHNERKIREWKRVEAGSLDPLNKEKAHNKVLEWQKRQRNHLDDNPELRRKYSREQIKTSAQSTQTVYQARR